MATVNGNPNWQMSLATSMSEIFTMGIVVSSNRGYRNLRRALSVTTKGDEKKEPSVAENPPQAPEHSEET